MKSVRFVSVFTTLLMLVLTAATAQAAAPPLTFTPATKAGYDSGGTSANNAILADVNRDGVLDMIVCNATGYSVFFGNGDGTFTLNNTYATAGTGANLCAVADVNHDGYLDIVATTYYNGNYTGGGVDVLLGNGDGTFNGPISYNAGPFGTFAIAIGDVNHDGYPDLVVTSDCQASGTCLNGNVTLLLGRGNGTFPDGGLPITVAAGTGPVALADMNGDGNLDIIYAGGVMLGDGTGDGIFTPVEGGELEGGAVAIAIADVNGDGFPDIVEATDNNDVDVLLGNNTGQLFKYANYKSGGDWPLSVTVADVNGDGFPDLIVGNECQFTQAGSGKGKCSTIGGIGILTNKGGAGQTFAGFNTALSFASGGYQASSVAVGDLIGTGKADLVVSNVCYSPNPNNTCSNDGWAGVLLNSSIFLTTTSVAATPSPSLVNQSFQLTANVTSKGGAIKNGDAVTFTQGATVLGTGYTSSGVATTSATLPVHGTFPVKATFGGDVWNQTSDGTESQVVDLWPTAVTNTATNPNPSAYKQAITLSASVSSSAPGGATGTVQFKAGTLILGTGTLVGGSTTVTTLKVLPVGANNITVTYEGDTQSDKSSTTFVQTVMN